MLGRVRFKIIDRHIQYKACSVVHACIRFLSVNLVCLFSLKVANHVLGSVLCCPGCFSVYRAKAIRDVLALYSSTADHAVDFLTKDMGKNSTDFILG